MKIRAGNLLPDSDPNRLADFGNLSNCSRCWCSRVVVVEAGKVVADIVVVAVVVVGKVAADIVLAAVVEAGKETADIVVVVAEVVVADDVVKPRSS